ncbi:MAG: hypothetical protein RBT65_12125 [Methanolobus sp.]|nr:hypothetical protein [Methanolobus sp.]
MSLFTLTNNFIVTVSNEYLQLKPFKAIYTKDKNRKKTGAMGIFSFIYFYADYKSPYVKYVEEERIDILKRDLGLSDDFKITQEIRLAIDMYKELNETISVSTLTDVRNAILMSGQVIKELTQSIKSTLLGTDEDESDIDVAVDRLNKLLTLSEKLPKVLNVIESLEEKVKIEQSKDTVIRGGGETGAFED